MKEYYNWNGKKWTNAVYWFTLFEFKFMNNLKIFHVDFWY